MTNPRDQLIDAYVAVFNRPPGTLQQLHELLAPDVHFVDPFNDLVGVESVHAMLIDFAEKVEQPRFDILYRAWDGEVCLLRWWMHGRVARLGDWSVPGVSEIHIDSNNRICEHIDHWDAATHLYQRLPLIGRVLRALRRKIATR